MSITTDHSLAIADKAHSHVTSYNGTTVPDASRAARASSFAPADFARPTGREEEWRFSPLRDLAPLLDDSPADADGARYDVVVPDGVTVGELAPGQAPRGTVLIPEDRVAAVASAGSSQALHLVIPANTELDEPARITVTGTSRALSHMVIESGANASGTVIIEHRGTGAFGGNVEIVVGDNSHLTVVSLQQWDDDAVHAGTHHARVGRDATYKHVAATLGGKTVRLGVNAEYAGTGGSAELVGLYYADAGQHLEHRTFIDHNTPKCTSDVTYKGALAGASARTVWIGDVLIRAAAEGTNTYELNRNLVLTDGARADSVPNLEIETGEIEGAGHASATGRFDDEQMFYLRSRGISESQARKLVVRGFFADVIRQIGVPEVEAGLMKQIDLELEQVEEDVRGE